MASSEAKAHILIFPFPSQGHMLPLLDLANKLAFRGVTITILVTPKNQPLLKPLLSTHPSVQTLVLPFPAHPSLPSGVEHSKDLPVHRIPMLMRSLGQLYDPLVKWFVSHPSPPVAIVSDMFLGWTQHLADRLNIRRIMFSPSGAMALSSICSLWLHMPKPDHNGMVSFDKMPNCPKYPWWQISSIYRNYVENKNDPDWEFLKESFRANLVSWGLVINSLTELEGASLDHLKKDFYHDNVWAVGPLHDSTSKHIDRGGPSSVYVENVMTWLDASEDNTVVYVCFGSQALLTKDQISELASSLERSRVKFIWCLRDHSNSEVLSGFEDRVAGRGFVIRGWAPQVLILNHPAIGAILTHCGWNSTLEALVAGVPMLAWPMGADQFVNATLFVDELRVAIRACEGAEAVPKSDELAQILDQSVSENRAERERAKKLSRHALDAVGDSGSSTKNLDCLVENLVRLKLEATRDT